MNDIISNLPGGAKLLEKVGSKVTDDQLKHTEAIILSMTPKERNHPDLLKGSRKKRIAAGAGVDVSDVNQLLRQFEQMQKAMKMFKRGGMKGIMNTMRGMMGAGGMMRGMMGGGGLPPMGGGGFKR